MSSCLRRRLSRRKFHHEPADIDGLSTLLSKVSVVTNSDKKGPSGNTHKPRRIRSENDVTRSCYKCKNKKLKRLSSSSPSPASLAKAHGRIDLDNDLEKISLKLGAISFEMDGMGNWTNSLKDSDMKELIETNARSNSRLSQENNLLRVKNELLADMASPSETKNN